MQIFRKGRFISKYYASIDIDKSIKPAIKSCKGLPLAIKYISGLYLQSDDDWQNVIQEIMRKDSDVYKGDTGYDFNIFDAFDSSVNQLEQDKQNLFRSLGVFKAANIPVVSIISLWGQLNIRKYDALTILEMLHRRSLLNCVDIDR